MLLDFVKSYLALTRSFYLCIFLQKLEKGIARGSQLCYKGDYVINPS